MTSLATTESPSDKPSLLLVDDEPSILTALRVVFRTACNVTVTTDGFEAIELLKTKKFDVIISDQRMPTMTGVDLLRQARDITPNTVRVLLTGYSDTDAILGAINDVEVHRFLQKPWDNVKLKQVVNEAVQLAKALAEAAPAPKLADVVPLPVQHRAHAANEGELPPNTNKETILVVDAKPGLFTQVKAEMANKIDVEHAASVVEVFNVLEQKPLNTMVCAFDAQSEGDRTFIQMLKKEHPYILVIAVCDSTDSTRLIELINQAKIFRFIKKPVSMTLLSRYIFSAVAHAEEVKNNPALIRKQQAEDLSETVTNSASAQQLRGHFNRINQTLASRVSKFLGFFRRN